MSRLGRGAAISTLLVALGASTSCMTTYDAAGYPVQSVDPGLALAGVAAAGLVGYAVANNNNHHYYHGNGYYHRGGGYYPRGGYYRGGGYHHGGGGYYRGGGGHHR